MGDPVVFYSRSTNQYAVFNGTNSWLMVSDNLADFDLTTQKFTISFWINFVTLDPYNDTLWSHGITGSGALEVGFDFNNSKLEFGQFHSSSSPTVRCPFAPVVGTWYFIEIVKNGDLATDWYMFINGVSQTKTFSYSWVPSWSWNPWGAQGYFPVMGIRNQTPQLYLGAKVDNFRYSVGVARHTSNYDAGTYPPTDPTLDEYDKILLYFNNNFIDVAERHTVTNQGIDDVTFGAAPGLPAIFYSRPTGHPAIFSSRDA